MTKLRCKPGDLAIYTKSTAGNEGKIVKCIRLATTQELNDIQWAPNSRPAWVIDRPMKTNWGFFHPIATDSKLTPIRPDLLSDETTEDKEVAA